MAKKFGKFLLFSAAAGAACAAAYYFLRKKDAVPAVNDDEDFDDFSDDLDDDTDASSRNYVPLNREQTEENDAAGDTAAEADTQNPITPLAEEVMETVTEKVEEFFDEDDKGSQDTPM